MFHLRKRIWTALAGSVLGALPNFVAAAEPAVPNPPADHDHDHDHGQAHNPPADHDKPPLVPAALPPAGEPAAPAGEPHDHAHDHPTEHGGPDEATGANRTVHLSAAGLKAADLAFETVGPGVIRQGWDAPGEIHFNGDAVAKIGTRVSGQVLAVQAVTGAKVAQGELLAVLQSTELGHAKMDYFTAVANLDLAQKEHRRATQVLEQTRGLLNALNAAGGGDASAERFQAIRLGESKATLLNARSAWNLAQAVAARTLQLKADNLVTAAEAELRQQEAASAYALYLGAREEAEIRGEIAVQQAERVLRLADLACQNAERQLHIYGYSDSQVAQLAAEPDEMVARYEVRAPVAGTVIRRDLAVGQKISDEHTAFLLADTAQVWCYLQVSSHRLGEVRAGQRLTITAPGLPTAIEASIAGVLPSIDEQSRTGTARAVLENPQGLLKPGLFVTARIETARAEAPVAVRATALQSIDNQAVVFVVSADGDEFTARPVTIGRHDGVWVEILAGVQAGEAVVVRNAFVLKAELGKAGAKHEH